MTTATLQRDDVLAERDLLGFGATIQIVRRGDAVYVAVQSDGNEQVLACDDGTDAMEKFHHPFAYGLTL